MQVVARAREGQLDVEHAAQHVGDRGLVDVQHAGVGDHADVGRELVPVGLEERLEVAAAGFLLALQHDGDRDREGAVASFQARNASMKVITWPLSSTAPRATTRWPRGPVDDRGLEGRALPEVQRVGRLDVVVAVVEEVRATAPAAVVVGERPGLAAGLDQAGLEAEARELVGEPLGAWRGVGRRRRGRCRCWGCAAAPSAARRCRRSSLARGRARAPRRSRPCLSPGTGRRAGGSAQ